MGHRIVSLLPSSTEIVCSLGLRDALVARSHECDEPASVSALPVCTRARLEDGSSKEIDSQVKALVGRALSIYEVLPEVLGEVQPSVILTQDQCEVCAASLPDVERALAEWTGAAVEVLSLSPQTLGDVWDDIVRVADALGVGGRGRALTRELAGRLSEIKEALGSISRPRVACVEWLEPPMAAGNWVPELVAIAGGEAIFGAIGEHSPWLDWGALVESDPDVMVLMPCGFDLARVRAELPALAGQPGFAQLRCVREGRVFLTDGNAFFNRPGPRLVESAEILAEVLHPARCDFGHRGSAWEPL